MGENQPANGHSMKNGSIFMALAIPGNPLTRAANFCVALRWRDNTRKFIKARGRAPNYIRPVMLADKMQRYKISCRNPLHRLFADKLAVREYVRKHAPEVYLPELYWQGGKKDLSHLPLETMPLPCVIKPNNASGKVIKLLSRDDVNEESIRATCQQWMNRGPHGKRYAEWGYQCVPTRILAEEFIGDPLSVHGITNYKFFVFDGKITYLQVEYAHATGKFLEFHDEKGVRMPWARWKIGGSVAKNVNLIPPEPLPDMFADMKGAALRLAANVTHVRVDLYAHNDRIYFSELTSYTGSGYSYIYDLNESFPGSPSEILDYELAKDWEPQRGSWIRLLICFFTGNRLSGYLCKPFYTNA